MIGLFLLILAGVLTLLVAIEVVAVSPFLPVSILLVIAAMVARWNYRRGNLP